MAYLALARKYRPQRFADMIGQEHVTRTLENAIKSDRVHHAYLFCGVRGLGKTTAARILAKCLVCEHGPTPEPCNACVQCVALNEGRSVDVIEIDGASNNSVDAIRSLREQVNYLPHSARRKIYIIDEVHMLTQQAFNALLKTLEEPPAHVTFMFATTDPHKVLPTILSRVSRLDYRRVRAATLVPYLREILRLEGFAIEDEGLYVIARCGEGSVRDSLSLLDKVIAFAQEPTAITTAEVLTVLGQASRFIVAELVSAVLARDVEAVLARFEDITSLGSDLMQLGIAILQHLRDLAVVKLTGSRAALLDMDDDLYEQIVAQAEGVDAELVAQHFDRFARTIDSLEHSRVPRLVIEMGLLELANAEPLLPLGDLVARLDALASGRPGPSGGPSGGSRGGGPSRGREPPPAGAAVRPAPPNPGPRAHAEPNRAQAEPSPDRAVPSPAQPIMPATKPSQPVALARPTQSEIVRPTPPPMVALPREPTILASPPAPPTPAPAPPTPAAVEVDEEIDRFEQLARDAGLLPKKLANGAAEPVRPSGPRPMIEPTEPIEPPRPTPRTEQPAPFSLTNEDLQPVAPASDPEAGCPSSRCTPREAIPWRTMTPWDAWESFLDRIRDEHDVLPPVLGDVGLARLDEGTIVLAAPANGFAHTQLRDNPELRMTFEHLAAEYFGELIRIELVDTTPSLTTAPSLTLVEAQRQSEHEAAVIADAQHHPRIRSLLRTFGGQLDRIEPLGAPSLPPVGQRGLPS